MRGEPRKVNNLTERERLTRLCRIRSMIDCGCDTAQVIERFGGSENEARKLMQQARALGRTQMAR